MPNHCTNSLHIDGELKHRQEFVDKNKGFHWGDMEKKGDYKQLSFHAQVPLPKKHINAYIKKSNSSWYGWCNKHWGTKWDCYEEDLNHTDNYTYYTFETAWCPPEAWILRISKKFPNLTFNVEWAEEGGDGGTFRVKQGEYFDVHSFNDMEWKEFMGYTEDDDEEW